MNFSITRIELYFTSLKNRFVDWWQIKNKGYADSETWSLDYSLSKWVLPRLKHLRNNVKSYPPNLELNPDLKIQPHGVLQCGEDDKSYLTLDEWKDRLDKMIYAFEFVLTEDDIIQKCYPVDFKWGFHLEKCKDRDGCSQIIFDDTRTPNYNYYEECEEKYKEGIKLFSLYFRHLWD
jgi:hypothetical protein